MTRADAVKGVKINNRRFKRFGAAYVLLISLIGTGLYFLQSAPEPRVPVLAGENYLSAYDDLTSAGLRADIVISSAGFVNPGNDNLNYQPPYQPVGTVLSQEPPAHKAVPQGSFVRITVFASPGPRPTRIMPNLVGMPWETAVSTLKSLGLNLIDLAPRILVRLSDYQSPGVFAGTQVVHQDLLPGSRVFCGSYIELTPGPDSVALISSHDFRQVASADQLALVSSDQFFVIDATSSYARALVAQETQNCRFIRDQALKYRDVLNNRMLSVAQECLRTMQAMPVLWHLEMPNGPCAVSGCDDMIKNVVNSSGDLHDLKQALSYDGYITR